MTKTEIQFLTLRETADLLGVAEATIYAWRHRGKGPRGYRVGGLVRYKLSDVLEWLEQRADRRDDL